MPNFKLTVEESNQLAEATVRVTQLYDMGLGTEEQRAWVNLAMVAGNIYIPKVFSGQPKQIVAHGGKPNGKVAEEVVTAPDWMN